MLFILWYAFVCLIVRRPPRSKHSDTLVPYAPLLRSPKPGVENRAALKQELASRAAALGFDGKALVSAAEARAVFAPADSIFEKGYRAISDAIDTARQRLGGLLRPHDPLVDTGLARAVASPAAARTQLSVASAVRILGERAAAWPVAPPA